MYVVPVVPSTILKTNLTDPATPVKGLSKVRLWPLKVAWLVAVESILLTAVGVAAVAIVGVRVCPVFAATAPFAIFSCVVEAGVYVKAHDVLAASAELVASVKTRAASAWPLFVAVTSKLVVPQATVAAAAGASVQLGSLSEALSLAAMGALHVKVKVMAERAPVTGLAMDNDAAEKVAAASATVGLIFEAAMTVPVVATVA